MDDVQKDEQYHEMAIMYNKELSEFAAGLARRLGNSVPARWAKSISKKHAYHQERHEEALAEIQKEKESIVRNTEDGGEDFVPPQPDKSPDLQPAASSPEATGGNA